MVGGKGVGGDCGGGGGGEGGSLTLIDMKETREVDVRMGRILKGAMGKKGDSCLA